MKKKILALLMGTSLVLAACGGGNDEGAETTDTAGAGDAAKLYENKCSACHGGDLVSGSAPDLDKIGSRLSQEDVEKVILEGQGAMPKGLLDENDAAKVAEWLAEKK
ncbi:cytochrome c551 [Peribacillus sp. Hz7]|uniref:cytochrome c551 n=1 Tax=Peribacillus sp. Hz7 TaxID=3344873 RepID=UPI0035C99B19